jgi:trigger factor
LLKSVEEINTTKKRVTLEIPADVIEREISNSLERLKQQVRIPGFRPGKAPTNLIEKRFGKEVEAEVLEKLVPEYYSTALKEAEIDPIATPVLEKELDFRRNNPINLTFLVEVMPKIENLDYENISTKDIPFTVEDSDVEDLLKRFQDQKAVYEVAEKNVEMDDLVSFEHVGSEIDGKEAGPSVKELISKMDKEIFPPDIMEKVLGKQKGDIVEFTVAFDKSKPKELAGKTVDIKVSISEVKKKKLPGIDDEFAKDLGFENMSDIREKLKERIYTAKKQQIQKIQKAYIINKLLESYNFDVPETLLDRELQALSMQQSVSDSEDDTALVESVSDIMETPAGEKTEGKEKTEDPQVKLKNKAMKNVQASIIIDTIGRKEGVIVTDEEVDEGIALLAKRLSATPLAVKTFYTYKHGSLDEIKRSIFQEKVMDLLLSKAGIEKGE